MIYEEFIQFINLIPRKTKFSAYDINYKSRVKSRMLGILVCFNLLSRVGKIKSSYIYLPSNLFSFIPQKVTGWVYLFSNATTSKFLGKIFRNIEKGDEFPVPPLKYLKHDIICLLKEFFILDKRGELTLFGNILKITREIVFALKAGKSINNVNIPNKFKPAALLFLHNILDLKNHPSEDFVALYVSGLIAIDKSMETYAMDSLGNLSIRVELLKEKFYTFFNNRSISIEKLIEENRSHVHIEADKDPAKEGFLVIHMPKLNVKGVKI